MMGANLVVLSLEPWDDVWRRNQYLIDGLLRRDTDLQVLFVEPANDLLHSLTTGRGIRRGRGLRVADGYEGRLSLYQPDKVLPRALGAAADMLLRSAVRRALKERGMQRGILWVNDPSWAGLVARTTDWPALYDITDDWLQADRPRRELRRIAANEQVLMQHCAQVVVCSSDLAQSRRRTRPVDLVPNAVDVGRYRDPHPRPDDLPTGATAVYVGTLHEDRLDVDLVLRTGEAIHAEGGTVVMVGPDALSEANSQRLRSHPGVRLLGARRWTEVPAYLQHATALIVPHVVSPFTESLDPIKLYEYRAAGRPVVSTRVAGFRSSDDPALVAVDGEAFPRVVVDVLRENPPTLHADDVPDWADRVAQFADVISSMAAR